MLHPTFASKKWSAGYATRSHAARARRRPDGSHPWRLSTHSLRPRTRLGRTFTRRLLLALRVRLVRPHHQLPLNAHHRLAYLVPSGDKDLAQHVVPITSNHARRLTRSAKACSPLMPNPSLRCTHSYLPSPRNSPSLPQRSVYSLTLLATRHNMAVGKARSQVPKRHVRTLYPQTLSRISIARPACMRRWPRWHPL